MPRLCRKINQPFPSDRICGCQWTSDCSQRDINNPGCMSVWSRDWPQSIRDPQRMQRQLTDGRLFVYFHRVGSAAQKYHLLTAAECRSHVTFQMWGQFCIVRSEIWLCPPCTYCGVCHVTVILVTCTTIYGNYPEHTRAGCFLYRSTAHVHCRVHVYSSNTGPVYPVEHSLMSFRENKNLMVRNK